MLPLMLPPTVPVPSPVVAPPPEFQFEPVWAEAVVVQALDDGSVHLDDGRHAQQAASCLLSPMAGDTVCVLHASSGVYVCAVLLRKAGVAHLSVPGAHTLSLQQQRIEIGAQQTLGLHCAGDLDLTSLHGSVRIQAQHLLTTVTASLVQTAKHWVSKVEHCVVEASALLRLHGLQGLITAKQDLKLDAERISLG